VQEGPIGGHLEKQRSSLVGGAWGAGWSPREGHPSQPAQEECLLRRTAAGRCHVTQLPRLTLLSSAHRTSMGLSEIAEQSFALQGHMLFFTCNRVLQNGKF
jgi:hypothetical protein